MTRLLVLILLALVIASLVLPKSTAESGYTAGKKLVCITFDDGWQNQYDNALPVLLANGFKASFAVVTGWIGEGSGADQAMGYSELRTLVAEGMDIASHTQTHPHLPRLDAAKLQAEVAGSKTDLEAEGFTVRMLVYPYYEPQTENTSVQTAVENAGYICARSGSLNNPYEPGNRTNPNAQYYIDAIEINNQDLGWFKTKVDAATDHSVICLCYHSVSDNLSAYSPRTPVTNFTEQMQYLKEGGFEVALLPDLVQDPWITLEPASLGFCGIQGSRNPTTQALNITNTGGGTMTWTASTGAEWLTLEPTGGTTPVTVAISANTAGLAAGSYSCNITVSAASTTNAPQTVPITLNIQTPSPGWLAGWNYRRQFTVGGSIAGALADYPMKLTINRSAGTDSGSTVYLGTSCAADYRDIRFTGSDGTTLLDYWIESENSTAATVWVELDAIPSSADPAVFNLYYGNSEASSASNIVNTFTFADDFEVPGVPDAARWSTGGGGGGSVTVGEGVMTVTAGTSNQKYAASVHNYTNAYVLHTRAMLDSVTGCSSYRLAGFVTTRGSYTNKFYTTTYRWHKQDVSFFAVSGNGDNSTTADMKIPADTAYHISECRRYAANGTNYDRFIIDGGTAVNGTRPCTTARYIYINSDEPNKAIIVDWVFLRKFVSPEPAWSAWGNEETPVTVTTGNASGIGSTSALLAGTLNYCGGIVSRYKFCRGTSSGIYTDNTTLSAETISIGPFSDNVTDLTPGVLYYYVAECTNSLGTGTGMERSFTTKPEAPTGMTANVINSTGIDLAWTKGTGAQKTMVRSRTDGISPSSPSDGVEVYFNTGSSFAHTGLLPNTTYNYTAWSWVEGSDVWSDDHVYASASTGPVIGIFGYMGIGTDNPQRPLHLLGNACLFERAQDSAGFIIKRTSANRWVFGVDEDPQSQFVIKSYPEGSPATVRMSIDLLGNVVIPGILSKGSGTFKIDHPLDPANRYLSHSFVESPDMLNVYSGNAVMDGEGKAVIQLPAYFETLNRDFSYQLEGVGEYAPLYIEREIKDNNFTIVGGRPGMKVSWQVVGIRQDPYANAHPVVVEQEKPDNEKGLYLHPRGWRLRGE